MFSKGYLPVTGRHDNYGLDFFLLQYQIRWAVAPSVGDLGHVGRNAGVGRLEEDGVTYRDPYVSSQNGGPVVSLTLTIYNFYFGMNLA